MYHQIDATQMFREHHLALLQEAESRRLARRLRGTRRRLGKAATALGFTAAPVVAGLMLVGASGPAHADAVFTVNSTLDGSDATLQDGRCDTNALAAGDQCTLRAAIEQANDGSGTDVINFDIPDIFGSGVKTIKPGSPLPGSIFPLIIDGSRSVAPR